MTIHFDIDAAVLEGAVLVEEAEALQARLKEQPGTAVNVAGCESMHTAVLQVILALRPDLQGQPADPWLARILERDISPQKGAP